MNDEHRWHAMRIWENVDGFEMAEIVSNNWKTGYEAIRVASAPP
jgi:hypothetical protein